MVKPVLTLPLAKQPDYALAAAASACSVDVEWSAPDSTTSLGAAEGDEKVLAALEALAPVDKAPLPFSSGSFDRTTRFAQVSEILDSLNGTLATQWVPNSSDLLSESY